MFTMRIYFTFWIQTKCWENVKQIVYNEENEGSACAKVISSNENKEQ